MTAPIGEVLADHNPLSNIPTPSIFNGTLTPGTYVISRPGSIPNPTVAVYPAPPNPPVSTAVDETDVTGSKTGPVTVGYKFRDLIIQNLNVRHSINSISLSWSRSLEMIDSVDNGYESWVSRFWVLRSTTRYPQNLDKGTIIGIIPADRDTDMYNFIDVPSASFPLYGMKPGIPYHYSVITEYVIPGPVNLFIYDPVYTTGYGLCTEY